GTVVLGIADITASDVDNSNAQLVYTVVAATHGTVLRNNIAVSSFTQADLVAGLVAFKHDGGEDDGAITLSLTDGGAAPAQVATVAIAVSPHVNDAPLLAGDNTIDVPEGGSVALTIADLTATDPDNTDAELVYTVTSKIHGKIQVAGVDASSFTHA